MTTEDFFLNLLEFNYMGENTFVHILICLHIFVVLLMRSREVAFYNNIRWNWLGNNMGHNRYSFYRRLHAASCMLVDAHVGATAAS